MMANVVDHLVPDGHDARALRDVDAAVVEDRQRRSERAARDAALPHREIFGAVQLRAEERAFRCGRGARLSCRRHRRHPAVWRIDEQRRLQLRLAPLDPVTGRPGGAAGAVCRHARDLFLFPFFEGGVLFGGHEQPGSVLRSPLDGHPDHVDARPDAVEIGVAPRGAWDDIAAESGRHLLGGALRLGVKAAGVKAGGSPNSSSAAAADIARSRVDTYFVSSITICTLALSRAAAGAA